VERLAVLGVSGQADDDEEKGFQHRLGSRYYTSPT
jgi:hypothetical protein